LNALTKQSFYLLSLFFLTTHPMEQGLTPCLPQEIWGVILNELFLQATTAEEVTKIYGPLPKVNKFFNALLKTELIRKYITQKTLEPLIENEYCKDIACDPDFFCESRLAQAAYYSYPLYLHWNADNESINNFHAIRSSSLNDAYSLLDLAMIANDFPSTKISALPTMHVILAKGANPNLKGGKYEETALHSSITHYEFDKIIDLLKKYGASVNIQDSQGDTPLHLAVRLYESVFNGDSQAKIITKLFEFKPDLTIKGLNNETAFEQIEGFKSEDPADPDVFENERKKLRQLFHDYEQKQQKK
jgi:hypothetical protein